MARTVVTVVFIVQARPIDNTLIGITFQESEYHNRMPTQQRAFLCRFL